VPWNRGNPARGFLSSGGSSMKAALSVLVSLAVAFFLVAGLSADDKDKKGEKTLKGTITCAKCDLKEADACATVIKVKEDGKDVVYYFDKAAHKKHHPKICKEPMEGTVVGKISEKDGKKIVTASKVEFK
jgi:hypothetical protein